MKRKLFAIIMCTLMFIVSAVPAFAAETSATDEIFELVSSSTLSGITRDVSWGYGNLYCTKPLFQNPQGYATTSTYSGNAYKIAANINIRDANGESYNSSIGAKENTSYAESSTLQSKTASCTFTGNHSIQDKSTTGWQYATTTKTYL